MRFYQLKLIMESTPRSNLKGFGEFTGVEQVLVAQDRVRDNDFKEQDFVVFLSKFNSLFKKVLLQSCIKSAAVSALSNADLFEPIDRIRSGFKSYSDESSAFFKDKSLFTLHEMTRFLDQIVSTYNDLSKLEGNNLLQTFLKCAEPIINFINQSKIEDFISEYILFVNGHSFNIWK